MSNMDPKVLRRKVENINTLPTIPSVLKRLSLVIEKPRITLVEISAFISNDPALTTKVLKMVNSAIYGFPRQDCLCFPRNYAFGTQRHQGTSAGCFRLRINAEDYERAL